MDEKPAMSRGHAPRTLPWMVALPALVLYGITLCRWLSPLNLEAIGQTAGWLWQLPYQNPLLFLICLPLRLLSPALYPMGANALAALLAALTLANLVRSVMLLPYDRTREGRLRGHADETSLHIRFAWVPPVFASAILGLQLSFWEHATSMTGEMLDLLVFGYCVRCLLEYRLDVRESWLWRMVFVYGLGVTNNWAMIGYTPFFLTALIWIRGFSFFNFGFLLRLTGLGACGLILYTLMPLWIVATKRVDAGFLTSLQTILVSQKTILLVMPRVKAFLLGLVCILPLIAMGIRWAGTRGSSIERGIATGAVYLLKLTWLVGCVLMMFDLPFSPRVMVQQEVGLAMLTFYYLAALVAGYFLGLFMLVLGTTPERAHAPKSSVPPIFSQALLAIIMIGACVAPVWLAIRNFPKARDTGALSDLAVELARPLPQQPSILVSDSMNYLWLMEAQRRRTPGAPNHLLIHTSEAKREDYQRYIEGRYAATWPEVTQFTQARNGVLQEFLKLLISYGDQGRAFYLHHSFGLFFEKIQIRPRGLINQIASYPAGTVWPTALSSAEIQLNNELWKHVEAAFLPHLGESRAGTHARLISRAANFSGAELQRAGRLEEAQRLFQFALKLAEKNSSTVTNVVVNEAIRSGRKLTVDAVKLENAMLTSRSVIQAVKAYGPTEDVTQLLVFGRNCLESPEELYRQAAAAFNRARQLMPDEFIPKSLLATAFLRAGHPEETTKLVQEMRERHSRQPLAAPEFAEMIGLESLARLIQGDPEGAIRLVTEAREAQPENVLILDTLSNLLISRSKTSEALKVVGDWIRMKPGDNAALLRLAQLQLMQGQNQAAADTLSVVLKKDPANRLALMSRATAYMALKRFDDARRDYSRLAEEFPDRPEIQYGLGEIATQQKNHAQALEHFEKYLRVAPGGTAEYSNAVQRVQSLKQKQL